MFLDSKQMQQRENKSNNNSQPLGVCQRLFNFIMYNLTARGLPHLTNPLTSRSIEVPVEGSSVFRGKPDYHPENSNSEIWIDFRHTDGLEHHIAENDNTIFNGERGSIRPVDIGTVTPTRKKETDSRGQVNGRELDSIPTGGSRGKPPQNAASINEGGEEKEKNKNKDKSTIAAAAAAGGGGEAEDKPMASPWGIPFLDNDINGRADEFIRQKRKDFLRRNTTVDLPKSK